MADEIVATDSFMFLFLAAIGYIIAFVVFRVLKNHAKAAYIVLFVIWLFPFSTTLEALFFEASFGAGMVAYVLINKLTLHKRLQN